jgi:hypothetical protein
MVLKGSNSQKSNGKYEKTDHSEEILGSLVKLDHYNQFNY